MSQLPTAPIQNQEWYQSLVDDCQGIITEGIFNWRWTLIETYHGVGCRILAETESFERSQIYGQKIVQNIAESLGRGERTIRYCVQFAREFPDLSLLPWGKNASWGKVVKLLSGGEDKDSPITFYNGMGQLEESHHRWIVRLPVGEQLDAKVGDNVHIVIKEQP